MADLVPVEASVKAGAGAQFIDATAGEALKAGNTVYLDSADADELGQGKAKLALAAGTIEQGALRGVCVNSAPGANQPVRIITRGQLALGITLVVGETYVMSASAGGIAPIADLVATNRVAHLGIAIDTLNIDVQINAPGVQKA